MPTNVLLVKYEGGWAERTTTADPERIEGLLALGALTSLAEVNRVADGQLDVFATPREQIELGLSPQAAKLPYSGFKPGDTIVVPLATGGTGSERVQSIAVTERDGDEPAFTLTVKDVILEAEEAFEAAVKKMSNGTIGGGAVTAQPAVPVFTGPAT